MKRWIVLIALTAVCFAAEEEKRRLESVTWNPVRRQLEWVISKGKVDGDQYKSDSRQQYNIDIDAATMSFSDETRRFSKGEAESVRRLLDFLARYAAESTLWWEEGHGEVVKKGVRVSLSPPPNPRPVEGSLQPPANSACQAASDPAATQPARDSSARASVTHAQERLGRSTASGSR